MDQISLEQTLAGLAVGPLRFFTQTGSTNSEALAWADAGAPDLSIIIADEQTAGRGRQGRTWLTPPGAALAFSLVLRQRLTTDRTPDQMARLTALGALAVCQTLEREYGLPAQIKWPNDVLLQRRKVCGVLAEAQWQGDSLSAVILGIGVNVTPASTPPVSEVIYPATCVETALGREVDRKQLLRAVLGNLLSWRARLEQAEFLRLWDEKLAFKGEQVYIYTGADAQSSLDERGVLVGLDATGCLQIRSQNGEMHRLNVGELHLRPAE